jgi:hypothetical protein
MPWKKKLLDPIRLKDERLLLTLGDVRKFLLEIIGEDADERTMRTILQLLTNAKDEPSRGVMFALQETLLIMLKAKGLA